MHTHPGIKLAVKWSDLRRCDQPPRVRASATRNPMCATPSDHY